MDFGTPTQTQLRGMAREYTGKRRLYGPTSDQAIAALLALETGRARSHGRPVKSAYLGRLQRMQRIRGKVTRLGGTIYKRRGRTAVTRVDPGNVVNKRLNQRLRTLERRLRGAEMALVVASTQQRRRYMGASKKSGTSTVPPQQPQTTVPGAQNPNGTTVNTVVQDTLMTNAVLSGRTRSAAEAGLSSPDTQRQAIGDNAPAHYFQTAGGDDDE